jgi:hypothetical protein
MVNGCASERAWLPAQEAEMAELRLDEASVNVDHFEEAGRLAPSDMVETLHANDGGDW